MAVRTRGTLSLSSDEEFKRSPVVKSLTQLGIYFKTRPSLRHNKCGLIEHKNGTVKLTLENIVQADTDLIPALFTSKSFFVEKFLYVSRLASSIKLFRGYVPSIFGNPSHKTPEELVYSHAQ